MPIFSNASCITIRMFTIPPLALCGDVMRLGSGHQTLTPLSGAAIYRRECLALAMVGFSDIKGLINLMGGNEYFTAKFDSVFAEPNKVKWALMED